MIFQYFMNSPKIMNPFMIFKLLRRKHLTLKS